ncbi:MAG: acyl-CoA dehydrogenase family protein [Burkholderiales bacterium]|uniref:acyl-CoA dehydrogenase family protein n=1 Tax=Polaromonas sp. TaxID=1869339 RepID=UPI00352A59F9|nr:acyl-CoA dehydrogenase family protein [Burkholderiales bacterium]
MTTTPDSEHAEQLNMLRESALSFAAKESPLTRARAQRRQTPGFERRFWTALAEQGWTGLLVPETMGGYEQGFAEMAEVVAALATQVAPEPVVPVLVFAGRLLTHAAPSELATRLLTEMAEGRTLPAVAWQEDITGAKDSPGQAATRLERQGDSLLLNGNKRHVRPGAGADGYIVSATDPNGLALVWVPADAAGLVVNSQALADGSYAAELDLNQVRLPASHLMAEGPGAVAALTRAYDETLIMTSVELLALVRSMLSMTQDYLRTRVQFGKPIGSFQSLQHRAVDLLIQQELTASVVTQAVALLDAQDGDATARSAMASRVKSRASDAGLQVAREAVQLHGAIGVTDEYDLGLYLQRALVLATWLGNGTQQRRRYADLTRNATAQEHA